MQAVGRFWEPWEAYLLAGRLRAEGVPAFAANDHHIYVYWLISNALQGVRVLVPNDSIETAHSIFARCETGEYEDLLAEMFGDIEIRRCPHCGARKFRRATPVWEIVLGLILMPWFGASPFRPHRWRCRVCGTRWRD